MVALKITFELPRDEGAGGRAENRRETTPSAVRRRLRQTDETNERRLTLYLAAGRRYAQGVRYVRKMIKHHGRGDILGFLKYASRYVWRSVRDDEVAQFRALKMIEKCYGSFDFRPPTAVNYNNNNDVDDNNNNNNNNYVNINNDLPPTIYHGRSSSKRQHGGGEQPRDRSASSRRLR